MARRMLAASAIYVDFVVKCQQAGVKPHLLGACDCPGMAESDAPRRAFRYESTEPRAIRRCQILDWRGRPDRPARKPTRPSTWAFGFSPPLGTVAPRRGAAAAAKAARKEAGVGRHGERKQGGRKGGGGGAVTNPVIGTGHYGRTTCRCGRAARFVFFQPGPRRPEGSVKPQHAPRASGHLLADRSRVRFAILSAATHGQPER